jgi:multidrug efflux pump subunit AcrA (membrane-fusion protein)
VKIYSELIGSGSWDAKLVRTEGAIDETARQLHVIAQIDDPFSAEHGGQTPPKIGQYVTAELTGRTVRNVIVVPNSTIYQGSYVYVVEDDILQRRDVVIAWQNDSDAIISSGVEHGDQLVTTPLGQVTSGIRVTIANAMGGGRRPDGASRPAATGTTQ